MMHRQRATLGAILGLGLRPCGGRSVRRATGATAPAAAINAAGLSVRRRSPANRRHRRERARRAGSRPHRLGLQRPARRQAAARAERAVDCLGAPTRRDHRRAPPGGLRSNEQSAGGRLIVLVIDQPNIPFGDMRPMRDAIEAFIDRLSNARSRGGCRIRHRARNPRRSSRTAISSSRALARLPGQQSEDRRR